MKLKHITFTGVDSKTDIDELVKIQMEYPIAEFGILTSVNWSENGNRYFNPADINNLVGKGLNLSCHVCGRAGRTAIENDWTVMESIFGRTAGLFQRAQLNHD